VTQPPAELLEALAAHQIEMPPETAAQLATYCQALWEWNGKMNLTRHTDYAKFVGRDLRDVLELSALIKEGEEVLDVGSGGGVPGVVLSILRPDLVISLSESTGKKASALQDIVAQVNLPVSVFAARAEDLCDDFRFTATTARAVGPLYKLLTWFQPHWVSLGRLLAIKGPKWVDERKEARHRGLMHGLQLRKVASYEMPDTGAESVILKIWPAGVPEVV